MFGRVVADIGGGSPGRFGEVKALRQVRTSVVAGLLVALGVSAVAAATVPAHATTGSAPAPSAESRHPVAGDEVSARSASKPVLTSSAKQVEEGDRYTLTATIKSPKTAARVTLEKFRLNIIWGTPEWEPVKTVKVGGKSKVAFKTVATDENNERYRVSVTYMKATRPVVSNQVGVAVWRWIPLSEYDPYYGTGGAIFGTTTINGVPYTGWGAASSSHVGAWESRFTPGRHCTSFKAVLGLGDISADGSSGTIAFTADDEQVYTSPALTPGMSVPVTVPLAKPYRFGIQMFDTTPGGTTGRDDVEAWPVLGEPAFLCTGV